MTEKMDEATLKAITDEEIRNSLGFVGGKLSEQRRKAMYYYLGKPIGDLAPPEVEGRSSVVSTDVADTVEWMLPNLLKIFTAGENVVEFAPQGAEDEAAAKQATDYVNYVFYKQNPGFLLMNSWFKDALLQKVGVLKVFWDSKRDETREEYQGLSDLELTMILQDDDLEVVEHSAYPDQSQQPVAAADAMMGLAQPVMLHDVTLKRVKDVSQVRIEAVPPEEFLISREAKSIESARFVAHRSIKTISELRAAGYKNIDDITSDDVGSYNMERMERISFDDEQAFVFGNNDSALDESQRQVWVTECYIKVDFDGDGISEWRKITRAGDQIIDNEEIDTPPFVAITPILLPHRFFGLSIADQAMEIQRSKTGVMRAALDNFYLSVNQRVGAVEGQVNLDDLLTSRPGGVVRMKSPSALVPINQPALGAAPIQMLEFLDTVKENRTGFTRYSQGNSADSLNKTATGINIITNRSDQRVELIARVFAETGVKDLFRKILKLVTQHQDKESVIRLNGQWAAIDPREWKNQFDLTINVGLGTGNKDQIVAHLNTLMQIQERGMQIGISDPQTIYHAASKLAENLGFKQASQFFIDPSSKPPQQPQPDPKLIEAQHKAQLEQWKAEQEFRLKEQELEATIALRREEMLLKYQQQQDPFTALYQQTQGMIDGPRTGNQPGQSGQGGFGQPDLPRGFQPTAGANSAGMAGLPGA